MDCSMPGFSVLHYLPGFAQLMSIELMIPSNHLILCCLLLLLPSIFPSIRVFSNESALHIIHLVLQKQKLRWSLICIPIQFSSIPQSWPTLCNPMDCGPPGFPVHHQLPQLTQTHVSWVGNAIQQSHLCCSLLLWPSVIPSIRVFSNESAFHNRWPKYWSFSFNITSSNEYSGLTSFRMDWWDLLAVQGTLKSLFQHHSSKASVLRRSAFFRVQLSHPYMTTAKTKVLTRWTLLAE